MVERTKGTGKRYSITSLRIVLDTNCLIQILSRHSEFRPVWDSIITGENILCITNEILEEYSEILHRMFGYQFAETVVAALLKSPFVERFSPYYHFNLITADSDDNKFVACAPKAIATSATRKV